MSIVLDVLIVALLVIFLLIGKKKGFVCTAIELLGWIAVAVFAIPLAQTAANWVYDVCIDNSICNAVNKTIVETSDGSLITAINDYIAKLPSFVSSQLAENEITASYILNQGELNDNIAGAVSNAVKPIIIPLISAIISIILAIVGIFCVRLLAKVCGGIVNRIPIVGSVNGLLGAMLGLVKGAVITGIAVFIISTVLNIRTEGIFGITSETVNNTYIFKVIAGLFK